MILFDLILYCFIRCEIGPEDGHITAKSFLSFFIYMITLFVANIFSLIVSGIKITQHVTENELTLFAVCVGIVLYFIVSRHYNRDMTGVEKARALMKKWNMDSLKWCIAVSFLVFILSVSVGYISYLIETTIFAN